MIDWQEIWDAILNNSVNSALYYNLKDGSIFSYYPQLERGFLYTSSIKSVMYSKEEIKANLDKQLHNQQFTDKINLYVK